MARPQAPIDRGESPQAAAIKPDIKQIIEQGMGGDSHAVRELLAQVYPLVRQERGGRISGSLAMLVETIRRASLLSARPALPPRTVIRNVRIVDVRRGLLTAPQAVVLAGERIAEITPGRQVQPAAGEHVVDGEGLYLMPGLFDAHVHYVDPESYALQIAHGVTFVRDMGGFGDQILSVRDQLNRGDMLGPEMITTGLILDGNPPVWPFSIACQTAAEGRDAVRQIAAKGVDQVKVYSRLEEGPYLAIVQAAHECGLKAVGHVPEAVKLRAALSAAQDSNEHLTGFGWAVAEMADQAPSGPRTFAGGLRAWSRYPFIDRQMLDELLGEVRRCNMTQCPTLTAILGMARSLDPAARSDGRLAFASPSTVAFWGQRSKDMAEPAAIALPFMQEMVGELHCAGVSLMCGTDLANAYVFAGASLHEEMALLQAAGIPAADVLRSATMVPARFCGVADRLGTVEVGHTASLVLLAADPLEDVRSVGRIAGVFLKGRYFSRAALDALLREIRGRMEVMQGGSLAGTTRL